MWGAFASVILRESIEILVGDFGERATHPKVVMSTINNGIQHDPVIDLNVTHVRGGKSLAYRHLLDRDLQDFSQLSDDGVFFQTGGQELFF